MIELVADACDNPMNTPCVLALGLILAVLLTACPQRSRVAVAPTTTNWVVTQFGDHHSKDGIWLVSVSAADYSLKLSREPSPERVAALNRDNILAFSTDGVTNTFWFDDWRARPGWFVLVEHDMRAWCYDGADFLWLLQVSPNGSSGSYGPRCFPCAVPGQVLARLTDTARNAIIKESR